MEERLQKLLSAAGVCSRRTAETYLIAGRVTVNGQTAHLGQRADPDRDEILVDGRPLAPRAEAVYILLNKPRGYVSTSRTSGGGGQWRSWWRTAGAGFIPWDGWTWIPRACCC